MISKIDGTKVKNMLGLSIHLKKYNLSIIDYYLKYEGFEIPKCLCGKDRKHNRSIIFNKTCGDSECLSKIDRNVSEETKEKIRKYRVEYLKKRSGKTAWERRSNGDMSYLEEWFDDKCMEFGLYSKYDICYDYSEYPYFIDFAFLNEKVAVELDGKCHFDNGLKRIEHDFKKDCYLIEKGWRVFRIRFDEVNDNKKIEELLLFIGESKEKNYDSRLYKYIEVKIKKTKQVKPKTNRNGILISILKEKIINSGVNFDRQGWVKEVSKILEISENKGGEWVKKNLPDLYKTCYKRGDNIKKVRNRTDKIRNNYYKKQLELSKVIENSDIDFNSLGWKMRVSEILGINRQVVHIWMAKYLPDLLLKSLNKKNYEDLVIYYKNNKELLKNSNYIKL